MDKRRPHCKLDHVKKLVMAGQVKTTQVARDCALELNLDVDGMISVVLALKASDFYKSMTSYENSKEWQDVYKPSTPFGELYVKLIVANDVLIISFKESES